MSARSHVYKYMAVRLLPCGWTKTLTMSGRVIRIALLVCSVCRCFCLADGMMKSALSVIVCVVVFAPSSLAAQRMRVLCWSAGVGPGGFTREKGQAYRKFARVETARTLRCCKNRQRIAFIGALHGYRALS